MLPSRTRISRPSGRREERVTITYRSQIPNPDLGDAGQSATGEDEGWEDEDTAAAAEGDEGEGGDAGDAGVAPAPAPAPVSRVPPQFKLDGAGLSPRGDLCRR